MPPEDQSAPETSSRPGISTAILFLVFITVASLFNLASAAFDPSASTLVKWLSAVLMMAPVAYGWWYYSRKRPQQFNSTLFMVLILSITASVVSRSLIKLVQQQILNSQERTSFFFVGLGLILLIALPWLQRSKRP